MKFLILSLLLTLNAAQAHEPKYLDIDMSGKHFHDQGFNLFDDGIDTEFDLVRIRLSKISGDFILANVVATSGDQSECQIKKVYSENRFTYVVVGGHWPEIDTGETCNIKFKYRDAGKAAQLMLEVTGT